MFVMGIDPGLSRCGYGVLSHSEGKTTAVAAGVITTPVDDPLPDRLFMLSNELEELLREFAVSEVAVEKVFFQTNVKTAMSVGQASGLALVAALRSGASVAQYTANEVKLSITGYGAADKLQMQRMIQASLNLPELPSPPDAADALALALCHLTVGPRMKKIAAATR